MLISWRYFSYLPCISHWSSWIIFSVHRFSFCCLRRQFECCQPLHPDARGSSTIVDHSGICHLCCCCCCCCCCWIVNTNFFAADVVALFRYPSWWAMQWVGFSFSVWVSLLKPFVQRNGPNQFVELDGLSLELVLVFNQQWSICQPVSCYPRIWLRCQSTYSAMCKKEFDFAAARASSSGLCSCKDDTKSFCAEIAHIHNMCIIIKNTQPAHSSCNPSWVPHSLAISSQRGGSISMSSGWPLNSFLVCPSCGNGIPKSCRGVVEWSLGLLWGSEAEKGFARSIAHRSTSRKRHAGDLKLCRWQGVRIRPIGVTCRWGS